MTRGKWKKLTELHGFIVCPYCHKKISSRKLATVDHVLPKSRFAETEVVICCRDCNSEKGALTDLEYQEWKSYQKSKKRLSKVNLARLKYLEQLRVYGR